MLNTRIYFNLIILTNFIVVNTVNGSIDGLSYMDPIRTRPLPTLYPKGEDPCNPLYWYPKSIPEYCDYKKIIISHKHTAPPLPMPLPVPVPQPIPSLPGPFPVFPPVPYGIPIAPSNPMLPVAWPSRTFFPNVPQIYSSAPLYNLYTNNIQQSGMVPGLPGLVTREGGINILPFSDAYTDLLNNHKNQMIRRRLQKLINEYEDFPNARSYRRLRKYAQTNM